MVEEDYVMRMIHEMIKILMKFLFNIDTDKVEKSESNIDKVEESESDIGKAEESKSDNIDKVEEPEGNPQEAIGNYNFLCALVDNGQINEAENRLTDILDVNDKSKLELALNFYDYLNTKDTDFLEENDFSREEIKDGIKSVTKIYGCESIISCIFNLAD